MQPSASALPDDDQFRHEAYLYAGVDEFVDGMASFISDGIKGGEPVLVVVAAEKIARLKGALGRDADRVRFADMADIGRNPACIIPAWRDFLSDFAVDGRPVRGIGEPIYPERSADELIECHRHESLLNLAFGGSGRWWLLCPYDVRALAPAVIDEAKRTHPYLSGGMGPLTSTAYAGLEAIAGPFDAPLPEPTGPVSHLAFDATSLGELRQHVAERAEAEGFATGQIADLLVAASELATNSVRHGGGAGYLRVWRDDGALVCEVRDAGRIGDALAGRRRPAPEQVGGRGLWLVNHLSDLVQIRTSRAGTVARMHLRRR
jgi:anti-sigma regulatory factor (Ser/Thr protein kinase)